MNVKKFLLNTVLIGAVAVAPIGLSSCDDDDNGNGGGNGGGPDISENSARVVLSDGASDTIASAGQRQVVDSVGSGDIGGTYSGSQITWADQAGNTVTVSVAKSGSDGAGTGTFSPLTFESIQDGSVPDQYSSVVVTYNGNSWSPDSNDGNVEVVTNDGNKLVGTINNVTLAQTTNPGSTTTVTVNGAFDIQK